MYRVIRFFYYSLINELDLKLFLVLRTEHHKVQSKKKSKNVLKQQFFLLYLKKRQ